MVTEAENTNTQPVAHKEAKKPLRRMDPALQESLMAEVRAKVAVPGYLREKAKDPNFRLVTRDNRDIFNSTLSLLPRANAWMDEDVVKPLVKYTAIGVGITGGIWYFIDKAIEIYRNHSS